MRKIDILTPCYNEEENILPFVNEVIRYTEHLNYDFRIIFIDDGSNDNTFETIKSASEMNNKIKVVAIKFSRNFGKESAIAAGLHYTTGDAAILIDADLQHPPNLIPSMIEEWEKGAKIVDGVKKTRGNEGFIKKIFSLSFYRIMSILTNMDFEGASDYKLLDREVIEKFKQLNEKTRFFRGLTNWMGYPHSKIDFIVETRHSGSSKWNFIELFKLSMEAITSYSSKPLHIVTFLGILTLIFSFILGLQTLYNKFFGHAVTGFTTVILVILIFSSIIMISIGIVGLYISKIFKEVKNRPLFIVDKCETFNDSEHNIIKKQF